MTQTKNKLCYELKINLTEDHKEIVASVLTELEVGDFVYGEIDCDLEAEYNPALAGQDLYEKQNPTTPLILYNEDKEYLASIEEALKSLFPKLNIPLEKETFLLQEIKNQNWRESWKESFKPVLIQNVFALLPPWENENHFSQKYKIIIDPGMAFGTGQHETTRLCLELMAQKNTPKRFFDVGTGSGILCLAAKMMGAHFVLGNDIDPQCKHVAEENAQKNKVTGIQFSDLPISEISENNFDLIVANIQSRPLKTLVPDILKRVAPQGEVILSGILVSEKEDFIAFLKEHNSNVIETKDLNHWCALVCQSPSAK
jgi:ribosomal protein L11 methyltransferase